MNKETNEINENSDEILEADLEKYDKVRHGYGIQLFGNSDKFQSRYAGQWERNHKHGEGECVYPDGAEYKGTFKLDQFDGYGEYKFAKNEEGLTHTYKG